MIEKVRKKGKYGSFFLVMEAPNTKKEPKVTETDVEDIDVDFTSEPRQTDVSQPEELDTDNQDGEDIDVNFSSNSAVTEPEGQQDSLTDTEQVPGGDEQQNAPNETNTDYGGEDVPPEENTEGEPTEQIDSGDPGITDDDVNTDFGEEEPEEGGDETQYDQSENDVQQGDTQNTDGPGLEYDSTRKYVLFKEYMSLYNALENYISKLESIIKDDIELNQIIIRSTNNLREIRDICYDYMIMKFEISTYVQSLVMYQKLEVAVQMVFNLINSANKLQNTNDKLKQ